MLTKQQRQCYANEAAVARHLTARCAEFHCQHLDGGCHVVLYQNIHEYNTHVNGHTELNTLRRLAMQTDA